MLQSVVFSSVTFKSAILMLAFWLFDFMFKLIYLFIHLPNLFSFVHGHGDAGAYPTYVY